MDPRVLRPPTDDREHQALAGIAALATSLDLPVEGAGILRTGTSVLVGLPVPGLLARVDRPGLAHRAERQVRVARALEALDVPAVRAFDEQVTPLHHVTGEAPGPLSEAVATLWWWEDVSDREATPAELGALAGRLHRRSHASDLLAGLAPCDPLAAVAEQLAGAADDDDVTTVFEAAAVLAPRWAAVVASTSMVLAHADLHAGNVIVADRGPLLADLELSGTGPAGYDVAPQVVAQRRYGRPAAELDAFLDAYGPDAPDRHVVDALVPVYELWVTAWAVSNRDLDDDHRREAELRLARWRDPSGATVTEADLHAGPDALPRWTLR